MLLHLAQEGQLIVLVKEHTAYYLCQDFLGRTRYTSIVQQMAGAVLGLCKERRGEPPRNRILIKSLISLKQFDALEQSAELILPAATGGEQLLEYQGAAAYLVLIPHEPTEIADGTQHGRGQQTAGSQARPRGDSRQQRHLDTTAKGLQLVTER